MQINNISADLFFKLIVFLNAAFEYIKVTQLLENVIWFIHLKRWRDEVGNWFIIAIDLFFRDDIR